MTHNAVDPTVRAAVEHELRHPQDPPRSRAALAREAGVSTRTVSRWADELGLTDPFTTRDVRAATEAATDRRRALRSTLADDLLLVEVPRLRALMAGPWRKTLIVPGGGFEPPTLEQIVEDDVLVARGLKDLHTALGIAVDKTIAIDRHDVQVEGDDAAAHTLGRLFDGLAAAYRVLDQHPDDGSEGP